MAKMNKARLMEAAKSVGVGVATGSALSYGYSKIPTRTTVATPATATTPALPAGSPNFLGKHPWIGPAATIAAGGIAALYSPVVGTALATLGGVYLVPVLQTAMAPAAPAPAAVTATATAPAATDSATDATAADDGTGAADVTKTATGIVISQLARQVGSLGDAVDSIGDVVRGIQARGTAQVLPLQTSPPMAAPPPTAAGITRRGGRDPWRQNG